MLLWCVVWKWAIATWEGNKKDGVLLSTNTTYNSVLSKGRSIQVEGKYIASQANLDMNTFDEDT